MTANLCFRFQDPAIFVRETFFLQRELQSLMTALTLSVVECSASYPDAFWTKPKGKSVFLPRV